MQVKIKKLHRDAKIPSYAKDGDAGMDLVAISKENKNGKRIYGTGLSIEIPEGYVGLIYPRSSIHKVNMRLANSVGVIDSGYRGEIKFMFRKSVQFNDISTEYQVGDRIGQLIIMPYPQVEFVETNELSETERNTGGFGSSGR